MVSIAARFEPFVGRYMYDCKVVEPEDNDMMRPFGVAPGMGMAPTHPQRRLPARPGGQTRESVKEPRPRVCGRGSVATGFGVPNFKAPEPRPTAESTALFYGGESADGLGVSSLISILRNWTVVVFLPQACSTR